MYKLFCSDISRLLKLTSFRLCAVLVLLGNSLNIAQECHAVKGYDYTFELKYMCIGVLIESTVVIGNLIGSDYSQSTVRNKIIAGYSRFEVFLSNWMTSFICVLFYTTETFLAICVSGHICGGVYSYPCEKTIGLAFLCLLLCAVLASFFTAWYMLVSVQSTAMTVSLIAIFVGAVLGAGILTSLVSTESFDDKDHIAESVMISENDPSAGHPADTDRDKTRDRHQDVNTIVEMVCIISPVSHFLGVDDKEFLPANITAMTVEIMLFFIGGYHVFKNRDIK